MITRITQYLAAAVVLGASVADAQAQGVELSSYIESLRQQFVTLASNGAGASFPLYISPIEVELTAAVVEEAGGGVKFYVLDAGASVSGTSTQKMKFTVSVGDPQQPYYRTMAPGIVQPPASQGYLNQPFNNTAYVGPMLQGFPANNTAYISPWKYNYQGVDPIIMYSPEGNLTRVPTTNEIMETPG